MVSNDPILTNLKKYNKVNFEVDFNNIKYSLDDFTKLVNSEIGRSLVIDFINSEYVGSFPKEIFIIDEKDESVQYLLLKSYLEKIDKLKNPISYKKLKHISSLNNKLGLVDVDILRYFEKGDPEDGNFYLYLSLNLSILDNDHVLFIKNYINPDKQFIRDYLTYMKPDVDKSTKKTEYDSLLTLKEFYNNVDNTLVKRFNDNSGLSLNIGDLNGIK